MGKELMIDRRCLLTTLKEAQEHVRPKQFRCELLESLLRAPLAFREVSHLHGHGGREGASISPW